MDDGFEIVGDDKGFSVIEHDEEDVIVDDEDYFGGNKKERSSHVDRAEEAEMMAISDLNNLKKDLRSELAEISSLKKEMAAQNVANRQLFEAHKKMLKQLSTEKNNFDNMNKKLSKNLNDVSNLKTSLNEAKENFDKDCSVLLDIISEMNSISSTVNTNKSLFEELTKFEEKTDKMSAEFEKIKKLRVEQEKLMNECKINIETLHCKYRDNLIISLDKSKSFACKECGTDIGLKEDIESKCYQVGQGSFTEKKRGYLFKHAVNLKLHEEKEENFTTGSYNISWVSCVKCMASMGWKYISCQNDANKNKIGKFCLARYELTSPEERSQKK